MSYIVYALVLLLLLWGVSFPHASRFHEDFLSLEVSKSLQGIAALCVLLHHVSQTDAFRKVGALSVFTEAGVLFVGLFFFFSGFGLVKSLRTKSGYLDTFLHRRLPTVVIPFYTMTAAFLLYYLFSGRDIPAARYVFCALGLSLANSHAWYIVVIVLLYLAFYGIFSRVKSERRAFSLMALVVLALIGLGLLSGHLAWWAGAPYWWQSEAGRNSASWWMGVAVWWFQGEWWYNATLFFFAGMLFAQCEKSVLQWLQHAYWVKLGIAACTCVAAAFLMLGALRDFSYWSEFGSGKTLGIGSKLVCLAAHTLFIASSLCFLLLLTMKVKILNPATRFLGIISLELYLMHNALLMAGAPLLEGGTSALALFLALVVCGGMALGTVFHYLNRPLVRIASR